MCDRCREISQRGIMQLKPAQLSTRATTACGVRQFLIHFNPSTPTAYRNSSQAASPGPTARLPTARLRHASSSCHRSLMAESTAHKRKAEAEDATTTVQASR